MKILHFMPVNKHHYDTYLISPITMVCRKNPNLEGQLKDLDTNVFKAAHVSLNMERNLPRILEINCE